MQRQHDTDELIPDPTVCREFNITPMTLWRWDQDQRLNFPPKIKIRTRNYRSRRALNEFRERMMRQALGQAGGVPEHQADV